MPDIDVRWLPVIVAAVINMVVGFLWYSKSLFGRQWAKETGKKLEEMTGSGSGYAITSVGALVQAYVLAHFVVYAGSDTFADGAVTGFWLWLAFVAIVMATNVVFEGRSWKLWQVNAGYFLVVLIINGGLLATWV